MDLTQVFGKVASWAGRQVQGQAWFRLPAQSRVNNSLSISFCQMLLWAKQLCSKLAEVHILRHRVLLPSHFLCTAWYLYTCSISNFCLFCIVWLYSLIVSFVHKINVANMSLCNVAFFLVTDSQQYTSLCLQAWPGIHPHLCIANRKRIWRCATQWVDLPGCKMVSERDLFKVW